MSDPRGDDPIDSGQCALVDAGEASMFKNIREDGGKPGAQALWVMVVYHFGRCRYTVWPALLRKFLSAIYHMLFKLVQFLTRIELLCEAKVGRHFIIDHFGGIIASFGDDCRIRNGLIVGLRRMDGPCAPWSATTAISGRAPSC